MMNAIYRPLYYPKITTPVLHLIGEYDPIIPSTDTQRLIQRCASSKTRHFVGGHFIPKDKLSRELMIDFISTNLGTVTAIADSGYASEADACNRES